MRAELRGLDSADAPEGLESFRPEDPEVFALLVGANIGPADDPGAELFYFVVCSAKYIEAHPPEKGFELMHSYLVISRWDFRLVERAIGDLCLHTSGADWDEIGVKLSRDTERASSRTRPLGCARVRKCTWSGAVNQLSHPATRSTSLAISRIGR